MKKINFNGLSQKKVKEQRENYGKNEIIINEKNSIILKILHILIEPMFLLLSVAAAIYFVLGDPKDGIVMLVFVFFIIFIDIFQELKTDKTLKALKDLSEPKISVIRDGKTIEISSVDLVIGDLMIIHEGVKIPADGIIVKCSSLLVNESLLTGEAIPNYKKVRINENEEVSYFKSDYCYAGTLVVQGTGIVLIDKIGLKTEYGKIGVNVTDTKKNISPLQNQINKLVKICAILAFILFILITIITYLNLSDHSFNDRIIESILSGITLAMAMIPEEFPVVLTVYLSMGAWRLAKQKSLVKKLPSIETLGAISVLCVDKTGTMTKNEMEVKEVYNFSKDKNILIETMGLCCEEETYDPMEKAMLNYCEEVNIKKSHLFSGKKLKEYIFTNESKIMGHVWFHDNTTILAVKGSPENVITICKLSEKNKIEIENKIFEMSNKGLRVIAVAKKEVKNVDELNDHLKDNILSFCGLIGLVDPPRENVKAEIQKCYKAGIRVVMITGDSGITASRIASEIGIKNSNIITGDMIDKMNDSELRENLKDVSIFSRVIPEHKMRIIKAFQANGEIVAMTGDGVNDAPALKHADVGIAMGKRGSEVAREAADLILLDDDFSTIVTTIEDGRRIYDNIKKAIGYIVAIHIPIALGTLLSPLLKISPNDLFLFPIHIVLLELIIDPTCSIVLERCPSEKNIMSRLPRNSKEPILKFKLLVKSLLQGLLIALGSYLSYYYFISNDYDSSIARTIGLVIIILSNLFLVLINSSETESTFKLFKTLIKDKVFVTINVVTILVLVLMVYTNLNSILLLSPLNVYQVIYVIFVSIIVTFVFEVYKYIKVLVKK